MSTSQESLAPWTPQSGTWNRADDADGVPFTEVIDGRSGTIRAHGHLDVRAADMLGGAVEALQGSGHVRILLDLGGVQAADAAGLRAIRSLEETVSAAGGRLRVLHRPRWATD